MRIEILVSTFSVALYAPDESLTHIVLGLRDHEGSGDINVLREQSQVNYKGLSEPCGRGIKSRDASGVMSQIGGEGLEREPRWWPCAKSS